MNTHPSLGSFALVNTDQIPSEDFCKLLKATKPEVGNPQVFRTGLVDAGFFVFIGEDPETWVEDFKLYSPRLQQIVRWAASIGATYLLLHPDCTHAEIGSLPIAPIKKASI